MRSGYTAQQIRDSEAPLLRAGEPLMQRAAHGLATRIRQLIDERRLAGPAREAVPPGRGRVLLLVGSGDNGGDALFAGAELAGDGYEVHAVATGTRMHAEGRDAADRAGVDFVAAGTPGSLPDGLSEFDVIVDGIIGTGTSGSPALRGRARGTVVAVLAVVTLPGAPAVVAVDIPSGIDPDSGEAPDDIVLPATVTVTFGGIKAGLLQGRGAELAGEVTLVQIGTQHELAAMKPTLSVE